jgi:hypothetical protein
MRKSFAERRINRPILMLFVCGLLAAATMTVSASPAAAFGLFGFRRGFAGPVARPVPPRFGGGRFAGRPPGRGGWPGRHPPIVGGGGAVGGGIVGGGIAGGAGATPPRTGGSSGGGNAGGGTPVAQGNLPYVPDEIITSFAPGTTPQAIDQVARRYDLTQVETQNFPLIGAGLYRWRIGGGRTVSSVVQALGSENSVASVQPNYLFTLQDGTAKPAGTPGDAAQYVLAELQIADAQHFATGKAVLVAVIDSMIDLKHADLGGSVVKSFDAVDGAAQPHAHGTAMAGAIAAHGKLLGIAPGVAILAIHAFDDTPGAAKGTSFAIDKGLQWATDNGAKIVNMSFAGPADPMMQRLLAAAYDKGIVLIAAAGNAGPQSEPLFPGADPDVIAVTATNDKDQVFKSANRGRYVAVAAPGVDILSLAPGGAYQLSTGTSIAAAHVSGIAALLLERQPALRPADIRNILIATAKPLGPPRPDSDVGAGLVSAYRAVTWLDRKPAAPAAAAQAKQ